MFGIITPHPLNFLRTRESIPLGRLQDSCRVLDRIQKRALFDWRRCVQDSKYLYSNLPVTLVSFERLCPLLYNVGLD